ncbi:MAG: carbohydrate-binding domain-containing protein [Oscillospiraceae bacterium]|nr:carbohydrate-binding domain-containing protein [Oscillospiraceae bacterium]
MPKSKNSKATALLLCICCMLSSCSQSRNSESQNAASQQTSTHSSASEIAMSSGTLDYPTEAVTGTEQNADTHITLSDDNIAIDGNGAQATDNIVTISSGGSYIINGTLSDGQLVVDTADEESVDIYLNGVKLSCSTSAAVNIISAPKKVKLISCEGSINIFSDGSDYHSSDSTEEDAVSAAIFSMEDLEIEGGGEIYVTSNCCKGIFSKDDLEITGGNLFITAVDDGIRGKDSLVISNAVLSISSSADGLRTSNETEENMGNMAISDSQVNITSALDGIQSVGTLTINNSTINVVSADGYENAQAHTDEFMHGGGFGGGHRGDGNFNGEMPDDFSRPDDFSMPDMPQDGFAPDMGQTPPDMNFAPVSYTQGAETETTTQSTKGIKSTGDLKITGGSVSINCADDAIHSNANCTISSGSFTIYAGDDALHADNTLTISGGEISVISSYEGIEASNIYINGGNVLITSSDDGLNASDGSSSGGGFGGGFAASDVSIVVSGGTTIVNAQGDGIDSNGTVGLSDGTLVVFGPTNGGNGALDYQVSFEVTGGTLLAVGSAQMAQSVSSSAFGVLNFNANTNADTIIQIADENGNEIFCFKTPKNFQNVIFTSPQIESSKTYTISTGGSYSQESANGILSNGTYEGAQNSQNVTAR